MAAEGMAHKRIEPLEQDSQAIAGQVIEVANAQIQAENDARLAVEQREAQEIAARLDEERAARLAAERRFDEERAARLAAERDAEEAAERDAEEAAERDAQARAAQIIEEAKAQIQAENDAKMAAERLAQERIEAAERDAQARIEAAERRFDEERAARLDAIDAKKAAERDAQERIEAAERDAQARAAQIIEEANERIEAANDAKMAAERLAQENAARFDAADSRWKGTYYSTISEVWGIESVTCERCHFEALFRKVCPDVYVETLTAARKPRNTAADDDNDDDESDASRSSRVTKNKEDVSWNMDIFGRGLRGPQTVVHLIPAAASAARTYDDVVAWVTGHREAAVRSKIIHGSRRPGRLHEPKPPREPKTGLKHLDCNKIRVIGQWVYMENPCVVVIPVMTLDAMLSWNGEQYNAIAMVDKWKRMSAQEVAFIGIGYIGESQSAADAEATNDEIELARERMVDVLCGLAFSLKDKGELYRISHNLFNIQGEITVPTAAGTQPAANRRVRKVRFGLAGLHPAPDPMLLTIKSALVWSVRNEQRLLRGGAQDNDYDDNSSILTEEDMIADATREQTEQQPHWPIAEEGVGAVNQSDSSSSTGAHGRDALEPPKYVHVPLPIVSSSDRAPMT